jgi:peptidoglycan/LPS O-acetylase OafA/YrhL
MSAQMPRRFYLIDALRGIAASWVVLFHIYIGKDLDLIYAQVPEFLAYFIFDLGVAGVPIFFVISGFVIAHSVGKDHVDAGYLARFTLRRSLRLDPPYWASMLFIVALTSLPALVRSEPVVLPSLSATFAHMFYLQDIVGFEQIGVVFWTLCLEIQFYLIFVALIMVAQRISSDSQTPLRLIFLAAAVISLLWPTEIRVENVFPGLFFPYWHGFLLGVFVYWAIRGVIRIRSYLIYCTIILVFAIKEQSIFSIAAGLTSLVVLLAAKYEYLYALNWRPLQFLGRISYSLYLTHDPVIYAGMYVIFAVVPHSQVSEFFAFLTISAGCIVFAYVFWLLFERWSIQLSKLVPLRAAPKAKRKENIERPLPVQSSS